MNKTVATYPEVKDWSILNSFDVLPTKLPYGSNRKVLWECSKGHVYEASIKSRCANHSGCPYCAGRRVLAGDNDLATLFPAIAAEWDYTKNGELTPDSVAASSNKKICWRCKAGHEWESTIDDRTRKKYGCPYCSGKRAVVGETDLATTNPQLAAQWHLTKNTPLTPSDVKAYSGKRVWWVCPECGHEWQAHIADRGQGCGCPACAGRVAMLGTTDLPTTNPDLAQEWNYIKNGDLLPTKVMAGSGKKVWWQCPECGYEWEAVIASRNAGRGCPCCSNKAAVTGVNDLATTNPELAAQWHPDKNGELTPAMVTVGSGKEVCWLGPCGHEWKADIHNRSKGNGCPICSGAKPLVGETDLATVNPKLVKEWDYERNGNLTPQMVTGKSGIEAYWQCVNGHSWKARISNRAALGEDCPYCWGRVASVGETDLATVNPELATQWHPTLNGALTPKMVTAGSVKKVWWQCPENPKHIWQATVNDRSDGRGCPICGNRQVFVGENDLASVNPQLAIQWHPDLNGKLTPHMVTAGSSLMVWWQCPENPKHIWQASVYSRNCGSGCPICDNRQVLVGQNDLATTHPEISTEWHPYKNRGLRPDEVTAGSSRWAWWKCDKCGFEWNAAVSYRCQGRGCPRCNGYRVRPERLI